MSGRILGRGVLLAKDGSIWPYRVVRWEASREYAADEVTVKLEPPDDPEHPLYGMYRDIPEFTATQLIEIADALEGDTRRPS